MDYGAAVAQKGYDVKTCADRFLVYSSAFQTLKIYATYSVSTTIPASGINWITIAHNLGYFSPFLVFYNGGTTISNACYFECANGMSNIEIYNDGNNIKIGVYAGFDLPTQNTGDTVYFTVYLFVDEFSTIAEKTVNSSIVSGASSQDYGIRVSKSGFDVKTCADINCILSSSFFNMLVHKRGVIYGDPAALTVSHTLGYVPLVFAWYVDDDGGGKLQLGTFTVNSTQVANFGSSGYNRWFYYIILKNQING